jgi:hypothetical protein
MKFEFKFEVEEEDLRNIMITCIVLGLATAFCYVYQLYF